MPYKDRSRQREYQKRWLAGRREAWLRQHGPCVRCGSSERLEVDHVDPEQKVSHRIWSWSKPRMEAELAKCQVLCRPCHVEKTHRQQWGGIQHGRIATYQRGCRCDECRGVNAARVRAQRRRPGRFG